MNRDDGFTRYTIRVPEDLYARVRKAAGVKSVNAEIVAALAERYPTPDPAPDLLEALEAAEHWLAEESESPEPGATKPDEILRVIRAALAKAQG